MNRDTLRWALLIFFIFIFGCKDESPPVLKLSSVPDENQKEMIRIYKPLAHYLTQQLGIPVEFVPAVDYADIVEGIAEKRIDIARCGGLTSVQIKKKSKGAERLVMRKADHHVRSVFITRLDTGIVTLDDLRGKTFTFGSVASTSGHLMPRYFLLIHGIDPDKDFRIRPSYSGLHSATVLWVERRKVDAGVLSMEAWEKLVKTGKVDIKTVVAFWTSPEYVDYVWMIREGLEEETAQKLKKSFLKLTPDNEQHTKILQLLRTKEFVPAKDELWKEIEKAAWKTGLIKDF
jgi:phosphonate transport system substrate-binding protein